MTPEEQELQRLMNKSEQGSDTPAVTLNPAPSTTTNTPAPTTGTHAPNFWGDADIDRAPAPAVPTTEGAPPAPGTLPATGTARVSKGLIDTGARTTVATIELALCTLCRPLINSRFKKEATKRFGDKVELALDFHEGVKRPEDDTQKTLKTRFERLLKQRDEKIAGLPFTPEEETDLERAFATYFTAKNVALSPEVLLICAIGTAVGGRAIDVFVWD